VYIHTVFSSSNCIFNQFLKFGKKELLMAEKIVVIGTGGTIAGRSAQAGDNVGYQAGQVAVADLLQAVPSLAGVLDGRELHVVQLAQVDSKDMDFALWRELVIACAAYLADPEVVSVIVTHGTDTLEETAFFLDQVLPVACLENKSVVLACAMRPATAVAPDGPQNLLDAVSVACSGARGVLAVCAGRVHSAQQVQKVHPYRLDAFDSGEAGPLGVVEEGRVRWLAVAPPATDASARISIEKLLPVSDWPRVEIVMSHAGASGHMVRSLCTELTGVPPVRGLVVAATGNGTVHLALEAALQEAQAGGVRVVRSTRCAQGQVIAGPKEVSLPLTPWSPVKARIALMLDLMA
jgi:L-asparaginase